jgi:preprotein translocase subunit SecG
MLYQIVIVVHILLGIGVIGLVLMQQGKGADAGAAFGSGASGSVFGAQGSASFLSRTTAIFATLFFLTSLGLAFLSGYQSKKADIILDAPSVEQPASDVPLSQNIADDAVPIAQVPAAPAIKEVEPGAE